MMEQVPGALGTSASLALRLGQTIFSSASLLFMCLDVEFYNYTSFSGSLWENCHDHHLDESSTVLGVLLRLNVGDDYLLSSFLSTFFSYLVTVMALVTPWSVSLALIDAYSVFIKCLPRQPRVLLIVIVGDWVYSKALSFLSLAAACSTASVTSLLVNVGTPYCWSKLCSRYQFSAAMAFLSWFLSFASTLFNLWLLPSL
ncbi:hypothetical protein Gotur_028886 [Gossypium turneri]